METKIERVVDIEIRLALQDLNSDFCHHLDHGNIDELVDLFCKDALYSHGDRVSHGTVEIRGLFQSRGSAVVRTSRHMQTGLRLNIESALRATGESVCMTFAANASAPVSPASPFLVADFIDEYKYCRDGRWRILKRHIERIFTASDNKGPIGTDNFGRQQQ
jgi:hypothetical protein